MQGCVAAADAHSLSLSLSNFAAAAAAPTLVVIVGAECWTSRRTCRCFLGVACEEPAELPLLALAAAGC